MVVLFRAFMHMNALKFVEPHKEIVLYLTGNDVEDWFQLCILKLVREEYDFKLSGLVNTHKQSFEFCSWRIAIADHNQSMALILQFYSMQPNGASISLILLLFDFISAIFFVGCCLHPPRSRGIFC